jgi:hypothetical protein
MTGRPWWGLRAGKDLEHDLQDPSEDWHVAHLLQHLPY